MKLLNSVSLRLALLCMALLIASALLLAAQHYWVTVYQPMHAVKRRVDREARELAQLYQTEGANAVTSSLDQRLRAGGARLPFHAFIARGGQVLSANLSGWPSQHGGDWLRLNADSHLDGEIQDHEPLLRDLLLGDGARLLVGRDIEDLDELEEKLGSLVAGVLGSCILLGVFGGMLLSRVIGRRIAEITRTARRVMDGDLSGRIPVRGSSDDFDELSATLNTMLARTEKLFESVRRVSDSVAHELRTPLARLRSSLDPMRLSRAPPSPEMLDDIAAEVELLEKTFDAVLRISRIESGRHGSAAALVDLSSVLRDAAELYMPAAEQRQQALRVAVADALVIRGDRDLLFQSVCNLLDNAIKYTPLGGVVQLVARKDIAVVELIVIDNGPGISEEHRPLVMERFYRIASTAGAPGVGLGLSLVAAVAERHESTLTLEDAGPGLTVRWRFVSAGTAGPLTS
jgi:signal transduction histidine kinase